MRRLRDLEDSDDPAVVALARLFRSVGDLEPPPGADERLCDALAQRARAPESGDPSAATRTLGPDSMGTVHAVEPERVDRALAVRPPRRRRSFAVAAIAAAVAILAVITLVAVRPRTGSDPAGASRPDVAATGSRAPVLPATDAIAPPRTEAPGSAAEPTLPERTAVPTHPQPPPPAPPPAPAPPRTLHLRTPGAPAEPIKRPPEPAPDTEQPGPDGWTPVDAATTAAAGVPSGGHLITSRTGSACRPGFICMYQRGNLRGVAYGISLGASISDLGKLRCPGCANGPTGNHATFAAQMSSWDNETDQRYCWYFDVDQTGKRNTMPPHTKRRAVPADNNDKAVSMGPC